jgi:DNA adenine methylase
MPCGYRHNTCRNIRTFLKKKVDRGINEAETSSRRTKIIQENHVSGVAGLSDSSNTKHLEISEPLRPLFKWSGGKSDEISRFKQYIPASYDTYLEPFVGGGALYFHLTPRKAVISDVHAELIDFYKCIKSGRSGEIYDFMDSHPNDEKTYYTVRGMDARNRVERASQFYYLRKTCFRGMLRYNRKGEFNISYGQYKTMNYDDLLIKEYESLLRRTIISRSPFESIFDEYNHKRNFMFLDPPYNSKFTDYGYCQFGENEHKRLAKLFMTTKIRCLMIIGGTDFIRNLYRDYIVDEYDKKYKFKIYGGRVGDEINTKHLVIKNYD